MTTHITVPRMYSPFYNYTENRLLFLYLKNNLIFECIIRFVIYASIFLLIYLLTTASICWRGWWKSRVELKILRFLTTTLQEYFLNKNVIFRRWISFIRFVFCVYFMSASLFQGSSGITGSQQHEHNPQTADGQEN
jgi:hypothetical protein